MTDSLTLTTDKLDYAPGENVLITTTVDAGSSVDYVVAHVTAGADGIIGTADDVIAYDLTGTGTTWTVTDGGPGDLDGIVNGSITTSWFVYDDALNQAFQLIATDITTGATATASFTDAPPPPKLAQDGNFNYSSNADVIDMTTVSAGTKVALPGDALGEFPTTVETGSGNFQPFVRIQTNLPQEEGYNSTALNDSWIKFDGTSYTNDQINSSNSPNFNPTVLLSNLAVVTIDGHQYYEFTLDANQNNNSLISLDSVQIFQSTHSDLGTTSLLGFDPQTAEGGTGTGFGSNATLAYDLDAGGDKSVWIDATAAGSGKPDFALFVPVESFDPANGNYIYFFSSFGGNTGTASDGSVNGTNTAGFEEWSAVTGTSGIQIDKVTLDGTATAATIAADFAAGGDGITIPIGDAITWIYQVKNTGTVALSDVTVTDDQPGVTPAAVLGSDNVHNIGDSNNDGKLDTTETWYFTANGTAVDTSALEGGDYNNIGTATGEFLGTPVSDTDPSSYLNESTPNPQGVISGDKYEDLTGNHQDDVGTDPLKDGWTIYLYKDDGSTTGQLDADDTFVGSFVTGSDAPTTGSFHFDNLSAGDYILVEGKQTGWVESPDSNATLVNPDHLSGTDPNGLADHGYLVTLATDSSTASGYEFGNFQTFDISGTKYIDLHGDGSIDGDSAAIGTAFTIDLYSWHDDGNDQIDDGELTLITSTETSTTDGTYSFTGLGPLSDGDKYVVQEEGKDGWTQTFGNDGYIVTPTSGTDSTANDFGNFEDFSISGTKYIDLHGDGSIDGDSAAIGTAFTIDLYSWHDDGNDQIDDGELTLITSTETSTTDGTYSFTGLGPLSDGDKYVVQEEGKDGWTQTFGNDGYIVTPTSGTDSTLNDFANFQDISLSGFKWGDVDGSKTWNGTEAGLNGFTIYVDTDNDPTNGYIAKTVTASDGTHNGAYSFDISLADILAFEDAHNLDGVTTLQVYEGSKSGYLQTYGGYTVDIQSGETVVGDYGATEDGNFGNHLFTPGTTGLTAGFWSAKSAVWDGKQDADWGNIVGSNIIGDSFNKSGIAVTKVTGNKYTGNDDLFYALSGHSYDGTTLTGNSTIGKLLLGDVNGNGIADAGENIIRIDLSVAQGLLANSTSGDFRVIMLNQAIAAQLNIYNGDLDPGKAWSPVGTGDKAAGDLITEATTWLKAYGGSLISDGTITSSDYNVSQKKFATDATYNATNFWNTSHDVDGTSNNVQATGQDLKNVLEAFNQGHLASDGVAIGWDGGSLTFNTADAFWQLAKDHLTWF